MRNMRAHVNLSPKSAVALWPMKTALKLEKAGRSQDLPDAS